MVRDSMTLDEVIQFIKQAFEKVNPDKRVSTEFRFTVGQVKQLLVWLEDYKQLKDDYADLDNRLRTANTEIDHLQSVSSWVSCSERMPEQSGEGQPPNVKCSDCVLVAACDWIGMAYYVTDGEESQWRFADAQNKPKIDWTEVTHWMPIPETPQ